ncbi:MAG: magnesium chelatase, partial [Syntrophomonadaceae bacterium]|nr:magnesium chelatase [Syntrophomonadaceae bacterium]
VCYMGRPDSVEVLANILKENSYSYKLKKAQQNKEEEIDHAPNDKYRQDIIKWAKMYQNTELPDFLRNYIARLYIKHNLESIRAIEAMQQGAVLHSIIRGRDKVLISDVTHMIPLVLKHRVDGDTLVKMINDVDVKGTRDGILNFKAKKNKKKQPETGDDYFQNARPLRDMARSELINTEKTLTPSEL